MTCSRGVEIVANKNIEECLSHHFDLVCLPGGMPGATRLQESGPLRQILVDHAHRDQLIGAICASPAVVLHHFGLLRGKHATCYPAPQFRGIVDLNTLSCRRHPWFFINCV